MKKNTLSLDCFSNRLKFIVKKSGGADVISQKTAIPRRTLETYLAGQTEPKLGKLLSLAESCGVSVQWLATGEGEVAEGMVAINEWVDIPLFDSSLQDNTEESRQRTAAVLPKLQPKLAAKLTQARLLTEIKFRRPSVMKYHLTTDELIAVRVSGDAMLPAVHNDDTLLIDCRQDQLRADDLGIFAIGPQLLVRRLQYLPNQQAQLTADQSSHSPIVFANHQQAEATWIGKVVWSARWLITA
jgi:phage repressor protein C with HTH and peptisase S24 domain